MANQYDETKKMLNVIRTLQNNYLAEQSNDVPDSEIKDDISVINDVDVKFISSDTSDLKMGEDDKQTISQVIDNFKQQVSQIVEFDPGFTIKPNEIRLDGNIKDEEIIFTLVAGENDGLYINTNMSEVNDEFVDVLTKLKNFQKVFKSSLEPLIDKLQNN